ncbi:hypothetical protein B0J14DRAFT_309624 [Halenospora varia]|nr:hypothetical protein B0J14DRAFT_309624 [Halenospora varia]
METAQALLLFSNAFSSLALASATPNTKASPSDPTTPTEAHPPDTLLTRYSPPHCPQDYKQCGVSFPLHILWEEGRGKELITNRHATAHPARSALKISDVRKENVAYKAEVGTE